MIHSQHQHHKQIHNHQTHLFSHQINKLISQTSFLLIGLLFIPNLLSISLYAQMQVTQNPIDSLYYKGGQLFSGLDTVLIMPEFPSIFIVSEYSDGMKDWEQEFDYQTKKRISSQLKYSNNKIVDGMYYRFNLNGEIISTENYFNGKADGLSVKYYDFQRQIVSKYGYFRNGKLEGLHIFLSENGEISGLEMYRNDTIVYLVSYYTNQMVHQKMELYGYDYTNIAYFINGKYEEYSEDGELIYTGNYKMGKPIFTHRYYHGKKLKKEIIYDNNGKQLEVREYTFD